MCDARNANANIDIRCGKGRRDGAEQRADNGPTDCAVLHSRFLLAFRGRNSMDAKAHAAKAQIATAFRMMMLPASIGTLGCQWAGVYSWIHTGVTTCNKAVLEVDEAADTCTPPS
ncbi:hypothetical protein [Cupriavidus sp. 8B]